MFSSSVAGAGFICLGCQLRAVTRRAAPVLAASVITHAPTAIRGRRYASDSSEPATSNDDFFASILNEQRFDDGFEDVAKQKKKKGPAYKVKSRRQRQAFTESRPEASPFYSDQEVGFEDVWDQDPDLKEGLPEPEGSVRKPGADTTVSTAEEPQSDEIDYGASSPQADLYLENYSWNTHSEAELRKQYADRKFRRPKKTQPQPQPQERTATLGGADVSKKSWAEILGKQSKKKADSGERLPRKSRVKHTDHLFDWGEESSAAPAKQQDAVEFDWGEEKTTESQYQQQSDVAFDGNERSFAAPAEQDDDIAFDWSETNNLRTQGTQGDVSFGSSESAPTEFQQPYTQEPQPTRTRYRKGQTMLVADPRQLPVETLGQDAPVIVLRERGPWKRKKLKQDERPVESGSNIEDYVDQEVGLSLDMIMENIDELRPEHRILPAREFKGVFDVLMNGFTALHLESYIERYRQRLAEGDETPFLGVIPDEVLSRPWIVSQSRWIPEVQGAVADVPHPLKGYILKTMPPKQRLAMKLMRECWGMSVQELLHGQGLLDLELRELEFRLLTLGNQRFLQQISRVQLGQGGGRSIQVIKPRRAIQILAPKAVAESCLQVLDETFDKIRTKSFTLEKLPVKSLSAEMLEELGRITNSLVKMNEARQEIEVTWIDTAERYNSQLEDTSDIVLRLILSAYPSTRTTQALTVYPDPAQQGRLVEDIGNKDKLPWNDRRIAWARLCLPVGTKAKTPQLAKRWPLNESMLRYKIEPVADDLIEPTSTIKPKKRAFYTSLAGVPLGFPRPPRESEMEQLKQILQPTRPTLSGWLPYRARTNAIFGHVLHLNNQYAAASIKTLTDAAPSSRRTVSPLIPAITGLDLPAWVPYKTPKYMTSLIIMRFIPTSSNASPASADAPAPTLELRLKATDENIIGIDSLRAIAHTHVADVCLPSEHVDIRATQRLVAELPGHQLDRTKGMQPLTQFLKDAQLKLGKGRLVTPPVLDGLGLPSWMFYAPENDIQSPFLRSRVLAELYDASKAEKTGGSKPKKPSKRAKKPTSTDAAAAAAAAYSPYEPTANTLTPTSYIFSGLEVHRSVETSYDGWKLLYRSVEAGAGGGRRAELDLEAVPSGDKDVRRQEPRVNADAWLRSVYNLAIGRVAKGKKGDEDAQEDVEESERATSLVKWVADKS